MPNSAVIDALLQPQTLTAVVKQVVGSADAILKFMGFEPGGSNEMDFGHARAGSFNIYDDSRKIAKGRAPGTAAGRSSKQNMKSVPFTYPRMHDSVDMLAETLHNMGLISDPASRDEAGRAWIARQTATLSQKAANFRVAMTIGMLRDQLYFYQNGDDWYPTYTSTNALFQINFQVPAGNKSQLQMTNRDGSAIPNELGATAPFIDVPWTSSGANIPLQIARINAARNSQGVGPIEDIHLNSLLWQSVVKNDYLAQQAGISNSPYEYYKRETGKRPDNTPVYEYIGRFNALPGIDFHISDAGLEIYNYVTASEPFTKHFPDTMAIMMSNPKSRPDGFSMYIGSEPIAEYDGGPETVRRGLSSWSKKTSNPTGTELYVLDNCLPVNHDPYSIDIATVAGF